MRDQARERAEKGREKTIEAGRLDSRAGRRSFNPGRVPAAERSDREIAAIEPGRPAERGEGVENR